MRYRLLDPLRGIAALWVFVFHYPISKAFDASLPHLHEVMRAGGRYGVPMFFVISGYCLSASAQQAMQRSEPPGRFLARRALRIYPTFWCSILFIILLHFAMLWLAHETHHSVPEPSLHRFSPYTWFDWLKVFSLAQIFDTSIERWWHRFDRVNGAYWSLAIEVQFYVVMALAVRWQRYFYPLLGLVTIASIAAYLVPPLHAATAPRGLFLPHWTAFAPGILLFAALDRGYTPQRVFGDDTQRVTLIALASIVTGILSLAAAGIRLEWFLFSLVFAGSLWLAQPWDQAWSECSTSPSRPLRTLARTLTVLGAMSYSLYLVHNQLFPFLLALASRWVTERGVFFDLAIIFATCAACYPFYRLCEKPFLRWSSTSGLRPTPVAPRP